MIAEVPSARHALGPAEAGTVDDDGKTRFGVPTAELLASARGSLGRPGALSLADAPDDDPTPLCSPDARLLALTRVGSTGPSAPRALVPTMRGAWPPGGPPARATAFRAPVAIAPPRDPSVRHLAAVAAASFVFAVVGACLALAWRGGWF